MNHERKEPDVRNSPLGRDAVKLADDYLDLQRRAACMFEALEYLSNLHPRRCNLAEVTRARAAMAQYKGEADASKMSTREVLRQGNQAFSQTRMTMNHECKEATSNELWQLPKATRDAIAEMRSHGYALVMFSPEEVGNADRVAVESRLVELGNEVINDLN